MKILEHKTTRLGLYALLHLLVDGACMFFMMAVAAPRIRDEGQGLLCLLIYNASAFALPVLLGILSDLLKRNHLLAALGCLLVAAGYALRARPLGMAACIGIGNGLYHIGSGRQVLQDARGRYAPAGLFIASGALGLFVGRRLGGLYMPLWNLFILLLCASAAALVALGLGERRFNAGGEALTAQAGYSGRLGAIGLLAAVVLIRSYYGTIVQYDWNSGLWMGLFFTLSIVAGKALGGLLADRMGLRRTVIFSLTLAALLALGSFSSPFCGCLSILFFNMTMPLTLSRMTEHLKLAPGFAFGLLMLCLFVGILPTMLWEKRWLLSPAGLAGLCLVSMLLLLAEAPREEKP